MTNNIGIFLCYLGDVILVIIKYDQQHWHISLLSWWCDTRDNQVWPTTLVHLFVYLDDVILMIIRYDQQHRYIFLLSWWRDTRDNLVGQLLVMALFIISEKKHSIFMSAGLRDPCPQVRWVSFTSFPSLFCLQAAPAICIFGRYEGVGKFGHFGNLQNLGHSQFKLSCTSLFFQ